MPKNAGYSIKPKLNEGGSGKGSYKKAVKAAWNDLKSDVKNATKSLHNTMFRKGIFGKGGLSKFYSKEKKEELNIKAYGGTPSGKSNVMVNTPQYTGKAPGMYK